MRVATYYNNQDIRIEERAVPQIGAGELLIKTRAAGICGSDVNEWYRAGKQGRVLGHEIAGEIVAVGAGLKKYKEGDRVTASHHVPCYECHFCKLGHHTLCDTLRQTNFDPGGFSELIRLPAINVRYGVYPLPDTISFEEGTLIEPLACTLRAQKKANVRPEQTVLVLGSGMAGLLHIHLAKALGARRVIATDINEYRLKAAKEFGADFAFNPSSTSTSEQREREGEAPMALPLEGATRAPIEELLQQIQTINEGRLADVVIACTGVKNATEQALQAVERGGTILFFALNNPEQIIALSMYEIFWKKGATLMNSYAASPEDHREALELLRTGKVEPQKMISHRLPFAEVGKGFAMVAQAKNSLKVIIDPTL